MLTPDFCLFMFILFLLYFYQKKNLGPLLVGLMMQRVWVNIVIDSLSPRENMPKGKRV